MRLSWRRVFPPSDGREYFTAIASTSECLVSFRVPQLDCVTVRDPNWLMVPRRRFSWSPLRPSVDRRFVESSIRVCEKRNRMRVGRNLVYVCMPDSVLDDTEYGPDYELLYAVFRDAAAVRRAAREVEVRTVMDA